MSRQLMSLSEDLTRKENFYQQKMSGIETKMESKVNEYQQVISNLSAQNEMQNVNFKVCGFSVYKKAWEICLIFCHIINFVVLFP